MIIDNQAQLVTTVAFDLETVRPGPGEPLKMWCILDTPGNLVITDGATSAAADALMTVSCTDSPTEFELPSTVARYIKSTFTGRVAFTLAGVQTAK